MMELGMAGRGEHAEIMTFVGSTVDSELSGQHDRPVPGGRADRKPFRYTARTWELVAPQERSARTTGSAATSSVQVKDDRVMRVLPLENEAINECWLSDKDRFSYEALNSAERLTEPMLKQGGEWMETSIGRRRSSIVANGLRRRRRKARRARALAALVAPHAHARGNVPAAQARARSGQRQHRLPPAPIGFSARRQAGRHRRGSACRSRSVSSAATGCWSSAASCARTIRCSRTDCARRLSKGAQVASLHSGRRRLADAGRAYGHRAAVAHADAAGGDRRRRGRRARRRQLPQALRGHRADGGRRRRSPRAC